MSFARRPGYAHRASIEDQREQRSAPRNDWNLPGGPSWQEDVDDGSARGTKFLRQRRERTHLVVTCIDHCLCEDQASGDGSATPRLPADPVPQREEDGAGDRSEDRRVDCLDRG